MSNKVTKQMATLLCVILLALFFIPTTVYATGGLNGVGDSTQGTEQSTVVSAPVDPVTNDTGVSDEENTADAIGDMIGKAGVKQKDIEEANKFIEPFVAIANKVMAGIMGVTITLMLLVTVLDLLYIAFPPVRDLLDGGRSGMANMQGGRGARGSRGTGMRRGGMMGGMQGGMMGGGMNPMMGGMQGGMMGGGMDPMGGMGGMQQPMMQQQQHGGGLSAIGRWVSDEAIAACQEAQMSQMMADPMMGGGAPGAKSMIISYFKKRTIFLVCFGVCFVVLTSTAFTQLGVKLGTWILKLVMGVA